MMYEILYQYLLQHKQLPLPGIGSFLLERRPAATDFLSKQVSPPSFELSFENMGDSPNAKFFKWLSNAQQIPYADAFAGFNDFVGGLKNKIFAGDIIQWKGVGTFSKGRSGEVKFIPENIPGHETAIRAEKILNKKTVHNVRVGEQHKTSTEMTEFLNKPAEKKSYWWTYSLLLFLLAVMFIGFYFSENGIKLNKTANNKKLVPMESTRIPYKIIP